MFGFPSILLDVEKCFIVAHARAEVAHSDTQPLLFGNPPFVGLKRPAAAAAVARLLSVPSRWAHFITPLGPAH